MLARAAGRAPGLMPRRPVPGVWTQRGVGPPTAPHWIAHGFFPQRDRGRSRTRLGPPPRRSARSRSRGAGSGTSRSTEARPGAFPPSPDRATRAPPERRAYGRTSGSSRARRERPAFRCCVACRSSLVSLQEFEETAPQADLPGNPLSRLRARGISPFSKGLLERSGRVARGDGGPARCLRRRAGVIRRTLPVRWSIERKGHRAAVFP